VIAPVGGPTLGSAAGPTHLADASVTDRHLEDRSREQYVQLLRGHVHVNLDGFVDAGDVYHVMIEPNVSWS